MKHQKITRKIIQNEAIKSDLSSSSSSTIMKSLFNALFFIVMMSVLTFDPKIALAYDGRTELSSADEVPIVLSQPGSYVLTSNLSVTMVDIQAIIVICNDVTIDLNGFTISGPNSTENLYGCGIFAVGRETVTIQNGRIWGFAIGINLSRDYENNIGSGHLIDHIQTPNNDTGIIVSGGIVSNCTSNNNRSYGFRIADGVIENCVANHNGTRGIDSDNSSVRYSITNNNGVDGVSAVSSTLIGCTSNSNQVKGFDILFSSMNNCNAVFNSVGINAQHSVVANSSTNF